MARGDVFLVDLPSSNRREQSGRRPAVAVQTDIRGEPLLMLAPITSRLKTLRYSFTIRIEPTKQNGLQRTSVVMVFQMRAIDKRRIIKKLGRLSSEDMKRVDDEIWRMLKPAE